MKFNNKTSNRLPQCFAAAVFSLLFASGTAHVEASVADQEAKAAEVVDIPGYVAQSSQLESKQISALKTPTPIINVPQSLSITDSEEIALRGFDSIGDIVDYTPGVSMSQGEGHRDAVVFRGIRSTADFFVDGVRDDVQYYRPLYNVEQVEILRGPNALLFGRGGPGGVLNRVMKKGQIGEDFNAYTFGLNTFGAADVQWDSNVSIDENTAFRINAHYEHLENHRDFFDGERIGVTPTFHFQFSEDSSLDVSYEYMDHERFVDRGIPTGADAKPVKAFEDIVFGSSKLNESTLEAHVFRALFQHRFSESLKGDLTASYGTYDKYYANIFADDYDPSTKVVTMTGYEDQTDRDNFILSGNVIGQFETGEIGHTLIFGAEFVDTTSKQDRNSALWSTSGNDKEDFLVTDPINFTQSFANGATSVNYSDPFDDTTSKLQVFSLYLQDEIQLLEQLQLVLGARYDRFDIDVSGFDNKGPINGSQTDEEITPRFGLIYKPRENISLYASYSKTFLPQSGEQFANLGDEGLAPDEFTNLEAGIKWDFIQGLSLTAAVFEIQQDVIRDDGSSGGFNEESEIQGFEAQLSGRLTDQWFVSAGYSYLKGEDANGIEPRELPKHSFSIWNRYQLTQKLGLGLGAIYYDESFASNGAAKPRATLPSYVRVDAAAYYQISENLRLQLNIENLLDELYFPSAHNDHQVTVGAPIHARLSISGRF
ncbi:MAG: TonB-dependent receptor [Opitutales bacterium]